MGFLQVRTLKRVAMPFSRDLPNPGIEPKAPKLELSIFSGGRVHLGDLVHSHAHIPEKLQGGIFKANPLGHVGSQILIALLFLKSLSSSAE